MVVSPLKQLQTQQGACWTEFANLRMPLRYTAGAIEEHRAVRSDVGLFDVSHMGQVDVQGSNAADFLETLVPSDIKNLPVGKAVYTVFTNEEGGILDDIIISHVIENHFRIVLNAARKLHDLDWLFSHKAASVTINHMPHYALLALQGPRAQKIMCELFGEVIQAISFMSSIILHHALYGAVVIGRMGYTGEDGFEISVHEDVAHLLWQSLTETHKVQACGLAARDSLRLEKGYPLYGHDIDSTTHLLEASLGWIIRKPIEGFIGSDRLASLTPSDVTRKRVGIILEEKGMLRAGYNLLDPEGKVIGQLTSGGFSPTLNRAIGQGYVPVAQIQSGMKIGVEIRDKVKQASISKLDMLAYLDILDTKEEV